MRCLEKGRRRHLVLLIGPHSGPGRPVALRGVIEDPNAAVHKQAQAASDRMKSKADSSRDNGNARETAST